VHRGQILDNVIHEKGNNIRSSSKHFEGFEEVDCLRGQQTLRGSMTKVLAHEGAMAMVLSERKNLRCALEDFRF
jgi:hypothetical protein